MTSMLTVKRVSTSERRAQPRNSHESRATTLIQSILKNPTHAAGDLETDLRAGGDRNVTFALLSAAESLASLRGIDIGAQVASIRQILKRAGFLR